MPKITDDELKTLRAKHPRGVIVLSAEPEMLDAITEPRQFAFRRPDRNGYAQYRAATKVALVSGGGSGEEETSLARAHCVWPSVEAFDELRDEAPHIAAMMGDAVAAEASAGMVLTRDPR